MTSPPRAYVWFGNAGAASGSSLDKKMIARSWQVTTGQIGTDTLPTIAQLKDAGYTHVGMDARFWGLGGSELALAYQAYQAGMNVFTIGNDTTWNPNLPIWTGSISNSTNASTLIPTSPVGSHPAATGWAAFNDTDARIYQTGVRATATVVAEFTNTLDGTKKPAVIVEQNPNGNGARFIHCQPQTDVVPAGAWASWLGWLENNGGGMPRYHDGSSWVYRSAAYHNGTAWVKRPIKAYTNGEWKNI